MNEEGGRYWDDLLSLPPYGVDGAGSGMVLEQRADGGVAIVGGFPEHAQFGGPALGNSLAPVVRKDGLRVRIRLSNGEADYVLTHYCRALDVALGARLYRKTWGPPGVGGPEGAAA